MEDWTITGRLQATLALMLVLAIASTALVWWLESRVTRAELRAASDREALVSQLQRVRHLMLDRMVAMHSLLADHETLVMQPAWWWTASPANRSWSSARSTRASPS
jgi:type II secretory pathway pseudopilin PulG